MQSFVLLATIFSSIYSAGHAANIPSNHGRRYANASNAAHHASSTSTAARLGDLIAGGIGMTETSSSSPPQSISRSSLFSSTRRYATGSSTIQPTPGTWSNASVAANNGSDDRCWTQWDDYWQSSDALTTLRSTYETFQPFMSKSEWSVSAYTSTSIFTETLTEGIGNFASKTWTTTVTSGQLITESWTIFTLQTGVMETVTARVSTTIPTPTCQLPTYMPQCQSIWETWVVESGGAGYDKPPCTQASITGSLCSTAQSSWLKAQGGQEISGKVGMAISYPTRNGTTVFSEAVNVWPTSSLIAPGCSVGCQSCRVSGSHVELLYWPPATAMNGNGSSSPNTAYHNGSIVATTKKPAGPVTVVTHGTTLTSPTVYISFDQLYASNSCSVMGSTLRNIIVAVTNSATLSSLYGWGHYFGGMQTASFNFTDLYHTSVPDEIYNSQPRCASSSDALLYSCLPLGTRAPPTCTEGFVCDRTLPYQPVLSIPMEVRQLQPEWSDCLGGLIGVYDPPSALHAVSAADAATMPAGMDSTSATTTSGGSIVTATPASPGSPVMTLPKTAAPEEAHTTTLSKSTSAAETKISLAAETQPANINSEPVEPSSTNALDVLTAAQSQLLASSDAAAIEISKAGATLSAGGAAVTISGQTISLVASGVVIDGTTAAFSQAAPEPASTPDVVFSFEPTTSESASQGRPSGIDGHSGSAVISKAPESAEDPPAAVLTLVGTPVTVEQGQPLVLGSSTVSMGGAPVVVGSHTIALGSSGLAVDGSNVAFTHAASEPAKTPVQRPQVIVTVGSNTVTIQQSQPIVVGGTTFTQGESPAIIDGQTISVGFSGVFVNGNSAAFTQPAPTTSNAPIAVFTLGSQTITAHQGQPLTLTQDNSPTSENAAISLATSAAAAVNSDQALTFTGNDQATNVAVQVGSEIVVINPTTTAVLASGEDAVIGSETIAFGSGDLVAAGSTLTSLPSIAAPQMTSWTAADGEEYTAIDQGSGVVIAGPDHTLTLADGGATTVAGESISALADGGGVLVNGTTLAIPQATTSFSSASLPAVTIVGQSTTVASRSSSPATTSSTSAARKLVVPWLWLALICAAWQILGIIT